MPDLAHTRPDLHAELESAAAEVHFGETEPPVESAGPSPEPVAEMEPAAEAELDAEPELIAAFEAAVEPEPDGEPLPALVTAAGEIPEPLPLWRDRRAWLSGFGSFSIHLAAMIILAVMAMALQDGNLVEAVRARLGDEDIAALDVHIDPAEIPESDLEATPSFNLETIHMERVTPADLEREFAADQFAPAFGVGETGSGLMFQKPGGGRAVSKGSFAVWTEPNDPEPGQNYLIIIEIAVPAKIKKFPGSDLSIEVLGTDTYYLNIPGTSTPEWVKGDLPIVNGKVQVPITIPGAAANVRDTIHVRSRKILRERQRLEIKF